MKIVTADQMREIEARAAAVGLPPEVLMENAGLAVAREILKYKGSIAGQEILVLVGPGNNGGDGLVAARHLQRWGARVKVYLCSKRPAGDKNLEIVNDRGIPVIRVEKDGDFSLLEEEINTAQVIVDSLFGTGKVRPLEGVYREALLKVSQARKKRRDLTLVALDLPSGLNPDSGAADAACPTADVTITMANPKRGMYAFPGAEKTGKIIVADIGIPENLSEDINVSLITEGWAAEHLPGRPLHANKGTFGKVMVAVGSPNYIGAAYLAAAAACRAGAGLVTAAAPSSLVPILAAKLTEATYLPLPEGDGGCIAGNAAELLEKSLDGYDALLIGCGIGQSLSTVEFVKALLLSGQGKLPRGIVIDADALNILSRVNNWWERMPGDAVLTPHPGEMSRLTGLPLEKIQAARLETSMEAAARWGKTVVLKGAFTIIASPDNRAMISPAAEPGLATAGTGDVLAGIIAAFLARGLDSFTAAALGVYIHAAAAKFVTAKQGPAGTVAGDLLPVLPYIIKGLGEKKDADKI